jgi:hypothetical protein
MILTGERLARFLSGNGGKRHPHVGNQERNQGRAGEGPARRPLPVSSPPKESHVGLSQMVQVPLFRDLSYESGMPEARINPCY